MSESCHTSRMREICTSGSQEGRGATVIGHVPLNPSSSSTRPLKFLPPTSGFYGPGASGGNGSG